MQSSEKITGAVMQPIFATSTYIQSSPGKHTGYEYSRTQNPTREAYEADITNLELVAISSSNFGQRPPHLAFLLAYYEASS